jgi:hypothetical protein
MRLATILVTLTLALPATVRAQPAGALLDGGALPDGARPDGARPDGGAAPTLALSLHLELAKPATTTALAPSDAAQLSRLQAKVKLARRLMPWHRALGLMTLAMLAVSNILGSLDYYDKYDARGTDTGQFAGWHEGVSIGATATFAATGALALIAPNPYRQPLALDRTLVHKLAMALAAVGFVAQIVIGPITSASDGKLYQRDLAVTHLVVGWATLGFMSAGVLSYVF